MPGPRPLTGEWMEIQFIRYTHRRTWRTMQASYPPAQKRKNVMARVRDEKQIRRDYQQLKQAMTDLYDHLGTPELYSREHLFWMTQTYMLEHDLPMTVAIERMNLILRQQRVALHTALYPDKEHQHIWKKLSVDGWVCRTCSVEGRWDGNDSSPMEVKK